AGGQMGLIAAYGCTMWWSASTTLAGRTRSTFGASAGVRYAQAGAEEKNGGNEPGLRHRCRPCWRETIWLICVLPDPPNRIWTIPSPKRQIVGSHFPPAIEPEHGMVKAGVSHRQAE